MQNYWYTPGNFKNYLSIQKCGNKVFRKRTNFYALENNIFFTIFSEISNFLYKNKNADMKFVASFLSITCDKFMQMTTWKLISIWSLSWAENFFQQMKIFHIQIHKKFIQLKWKNIIQMNDELVFKHFPFANPRFLCSGIITCGCISWMKIC